MKIILLAGNKYIGKTTTLNMVYNQLAQNMPNPPQQVNCVQACPQHYVLIKTTNNHIADCQNIIRNI